MNGRIPSKIVRLLSFSLLLVPVALRGQDDLTEKSKRIQAFLFAGKFDEAEPLVRECLRQVPEVLYFLSQLDMVLNGQGKYRDADKIRDQIRTIWEKKYKDKWIAKGAPISESSWSRMNVPVTQAIQLSSGITFPSRENPPRLDLCFVAGRTASRIAKTSTGMLWPVISNGPPPADLCNKTTDGALRAAKQIEHNTSFVQSTAEIIDRETGVNRGYSR